MDAKNCVIIDDSLMSQAYLKNMYEEEGWQVVGCFTSIKSAINTIIKKSPDLISMDFNLENGNAVNQLRKFKNSISYSKILYVTQVDDTRHFISMYETSACGIACKSNLNSLRKIIRSTSKGIRCYDESVSNKLLQYHIDTKCLTTQERQTFVALMSGESISKISEMISMCDRTIWKHKRNIIHKLSRNTFSKYCTINT